MIGLWLLACDRAADTDRPVRYEPLDVYAQVPCEAAGEQGLAIRAQASPAPRHDDAFPVVIRVWPPHRHGFEDVIPTAPLLDRGAALVRLLDPGDGMEGHASGGPVGESGLARVEALRCALGWVQASFPRPVSSVVVTGQSLGGNTALHAAFEDGVDGVVLFESPLVDQLVADEPAPANVPDPTFVPGSCSLDGCPFEGRGPLLAWDGRLWVDVDQDGAVGDAEPVERFMPAPDDKIGFLSLDLFDAVMANGARLFGGPPPAEFPSRATTADYWAYRDATAPLVRARDEHVGRFVFVATEVDHLQPFHDHVRIAQATLGQAAWFRLNADAAYVAATGAPDVGERPAFELAEDPDAEGALPEGNDDPFVLAAELELADRAWADRWEPDLDAVLAP